MKRKSKAAKDKLGERPFNTIAEFNLLREDIRKAVIRQLEMAKAMDEYTKLDDYKFYKKKFEQGMHCRYGKNKDDIVHVYMTDETGVQVDINENLNVKHTCEKEFVGILIQSMSKALLESYYKSLGYLPGDNNFENEITKILEASKLG